MNDSFERFPDGTPVNPWFHDVRVPSPEEMGRPYSFREYGIPCDGSLQTEAIQNLIDRAAEEGGGVIVVNEGTYVSGALHFPAT